MGRHVQVSGFLVEAFLTSLLLFFHQKDKNQLKMRESQREEKTRPGNGTQLRETHILKFLLSKLKIHRSQALLFA